MTRSALPHGERPTLEVVLVAHDQAAELDLLVRRLHAELTRRLAPGWSLTIADHASSDATLAEAERLSLTLAHVRAVRLPDRLDPKALRAQWSDVWADTVAFIRVDAGTDLDALLAPLTSAGPVAPAAPEPTGFRRRMNRRAALLTLGGASLTAFLVACGSSSPAAKVLGSASGTKAPVSVTSTTTPTATTTATTSAAVTLAPELTEGPYYIDLNLVRTNIVEDRVGSPFALDLVVVDTKGAPVAGAAVDIWHCDADGFYSGFVAASHQTNGSGSSADDGTFLRGTQLTDATGKASFATIYPGWYQGRTVHIHVKVHVSGRSIHTGQLFFDDAFTDQAFTVTPYSARGTRTTRNANDQIFNGGGAATVLAITGSSSAYAATLTLGVSV